MTAKKTIKKEIAKELKETIITLSKRMSKVESINDKIRQRLGL